MQSLFRSLFQATRIQSPCPTFEATLITPEAPFDKYLRGDSNALTPEQKEGLKLFMDRGCATCHAGINVGGQMYAPFGVVEKPGADFLPPADKGRFEVTKTVSDEYVFRVPPLRNIELTPPYFHTGKSWDLRQAVAVMGTSQLGERLTDDEIAKVTAYLKSLTGKQPQVTYPILPPRTIAHYPFIAVVTTLSLGALITNTWTDQHEPARLSLPLASVRSLPT